MVENDIPDLPDKAKSPSFFYVSMQGTNIRYQIRCRRKHLHILVLISEIPMKNCVLLSFMFILVTVAASAQAPVSYDDVGVIVNINDTNSVAIADYFMGERDVPLRNRIEIDAPAKETITPEEFADIRSQLETHLTTTGLKDSLNYFVTTKGVPLRVNFGGTLIQPDMRNASFDAEIMLILGRLANHIGANTLIAPPGNKIRTHPYFTMDEHYARSKIVPGSTLPYDMFLTTRLTGLTRDDVFALIDRSGPFTLVDKDSALFVFDRDPRPIQLVPYDSNLAIAGDLLAGDGWNVHVNSDSVFVTDQRNVLGYASWGTNDHYDHHYATKARPRNHWLPGSIAETYVSTSARNFTPGQIGGQSRIADLIAEGCTGASGYVFEPYSVALTWVNLLYDRYTRGYNLAESYYMTNPTISWMATIVGDPKSSIITEIPPAPKPLLDAPAAICEGEELHLRAREASFGWTYWFRGDSATVLSAGMPLDQQHPLWLASDTTLSETASGIGTQMFTFMNENFVGRSIAQVSVEILPELVVSYTASADTVYLDRDPRVLFSASTPGAVTWTWNFGDGSSSSDPAPAHRYTTTGSYTVSVTIGNGTCSKTVHDTIVVLDTQVGVDDDALLPIAMTLEANFPNPFASATTIPFQLPARGHVRLSIVDALGRVLTRLVDEVMPQGSHSIEWMPEQLRSGTYLCVLESEGHRIVRRVTLMK